MKLYCAVMRSDKNPRNPAVLRHWPQCHGGVYGLPRITLEPVAPFSPLAM